MHDTDQKSLYFASVNKNPEVPQVALPIAPSQSVSAGTVARNGVSSSSTAVPTQRAAFGSAGASAAAQQEPESNEAKRGCRTKLDAIRNTFEAMRRIGLSSEFFKIAGRASEDDLSSKNEELVGVAKELTKHLSDVLIFLRDDDDIIVVTCLESIAGFEWICLAGVSWRYYMREAGVDLHKGITRTVEFIVAILESKPSISQRLVMDALLSFVCGKPFGNCDLEDVYRRPLTRYGLLSYRYYEFLDYGFLIGSRPLETIRILGHSLRHSDEKVVSSAVEILCQLQRPEIIEYLSPHLQASSADQVTRVSDAFRSLWFSGRDAEQTKWRYQAGEALGRCIISSRGLDIPTRMACIKATASGKYPSAKPWLLDATSDPDDKLRQEVLYCLAELGDETGLAELLKAAKGDSQIGYRTLNVFVSQKYLKALPAIEEKACSAKDQTTLRGYIEPLKELSSKKVKMLESLLAFLPEKLVTATQATQVPVVNPRSKFGIVGLLISATLGKMARERRSTRRDFLTPWRLFGKSRDD